jgi:CBS domain-containing protein
MNAEVTVRDLMDREYVGVSESDALVETVELLLREDAETAVVVRGSDPVGVVTERDILASIVEGPDPSEATVADVMTESIPTVSPDATLEAAADRMSAKSARRLVVTNSGEPLGVITEHDLLATRTPDPAETERAAVATSASGTAMGAEAETDVEDSFNDQGVCEACGSFAGDLASFNGQLLCSDCREM